MPYRNSVLTPRESMKLKFRSLSLLAVACLLVHGLARLDADDGSAESFLATPQHVGKPRSPDHAVTNRAFQGIPSLALAPGGRIWAIWYAGVTPGEDDNNYVVVSTSGDDGVDVDGNDRDRSGWRGTGSHV